MLPHRVCLAFETWIIALMIVGNGLTALAYVLIPFLLHRILRDTTRLKAMPQEHFAHYYDCFFGSRYWLSTLFQSFILACGAGHIMDIVVLYQPLYKLQVFIDLWTGLTSIITVLLLYLVRKSAIRCSAE